jgi:hypothetical protein
LSGKVGNGKGRRGLKGIVNGVEREHVNEGVLREAELAVQEV